MIMYLEYSTCTAVCLPSLPNWFADSAISGRLDSSWVTKAWNSSATCPPTLSRTPLPDAPICPLMPLSSWAASFHAWPRACRLSSSPLGQA